MDRKSSEFVSFLLVTICLWCGFAFGANEGCDYDEMFKSCFQNYQHRDRLNQMMGVERLFLFFGSNGTMRDTCSQVNDVRRCIREKASGCRANAKSRYEMMWPKAEKGIDYVCVDKINVFANENNKKCLQKQDVVSKAITCQDKIKQTAHRRYARHSCSEVTEAVKCIKDVVTERCNVETGAAMERTASIFLSLTDVSHDCDSGSDATSGISRLVLSFAFILAVLGWKSG